MVNGKAIRSQSQVAWYDDISAMLKLQTNKLSHQEKEKVIEYLSAHLVKEIVSRWEIIEPNMYELQINWVTTITLKKYKEKKENETPKEKRQLTVEVDMKSKKSNSQLDMVFFSHKIWSKKAKQIDYYVNTNQADAFKKIDTSEINWLDSLLTRLTKIERILSKKNNEITTQVSEKASTAVLETLDNVNN